MKNKDQQLLEKVYGRVLQNDSLDHIREEFEDQVPSRIESIHVRNFWNAFRKYQKGEMSRPQWGDICIEILTEIMEKNRDILARLKN